MWTFLAQVSSNPTVIALIALVSAALGGAVPYFFLRAKNAAETHKIGFDSEKVRAEEDAITIGTANEVVQMVREQMKQMHLDLVETKTLLGEAHANINELSAQLTELRSEIVDQDAWRRENRRLTVDLAASQQQILDLGRELATERQRRTRVNDDQKEPT